LSGRPEKNNDISFQARMERLSINKMIIGQCKRIEIGKGRGGEDGNTGCDVRDGAGLGEQRRGEKLSTGRARERKTSETRPPKYDMLDSRWTTGEGKLWENDKSEEVWRVLHCTHLAGVPFPFPSAVFSRVGAALLDEVRLMSSLA
jgi:hypothetical protein